MPHAGALRRQPAQRQLFTELPQAVVDGREIVPVQDRHASYVQITDHLRERLISETQRMLGPDPARRVPSIVHVRLGAIAEQIAALAGEISADLVVVGTHGRRGVRHLLIGSVAEKAVRLSPCPVLVVRAKNTHVLDNLPAIEPPCPQCVKAREESSGTEWWCEAHRRAPEESHAYSYSGRLDDVPTPAMYR